MNRPRRPGRRIEGLVGNGYCHFVIQNEIHQEWVSVDK